MPKDRLQSSLSIMQSAPARLIAFVKAWVIRNFLLSGLKIDNYWNGVI